MPAFLSFCFLISLIACNKDKTHLTAKEKQLTVKEWNPEKFIADGKLIDQMVADYITKVLARNEYPEKNYRACQRIINFKKRVGETRLINACKRADSFNVYNYGMIERILLSKADFIPLDEEQTMNQWDELVHLLVQSEGMTAVPFVATWP